MEETLELELDIEELKKEADQLGLKYMKNIGAEKLKAKIDEYYESQETSGKEIQEAVEAKEKSEEKSAESGDKRLAKLTKIAEKKAEANKTRVVTIIDNDQRVNSKVTTCKVTCANAYFDLGTVTIPLNVPVEVKQGHIDVLKSLRIPQHNDMIKANKNSTGGYRLVPRFTVVYEDIK